MNSLSLGSRAKVTRLIDLLARYGVLLKEPYTRQVKGKIRDRTGKIRVLYFAFAGRRFILLHGFIKKTEKTPIRDIELSEKRMNDFIKRYGGE